MVKNVLLKNLRDKKTSAETVMKMHRMVVRIKKKEKEKRRKKNEI